VSANMKPVVSANMKPVVSVNMKPVVSANMKPVLHTTRDPQCAEMWRRRRGALKVVEGIDLTAFNKFRPYATPSVRVHVYVPPCAPVLGSTPSVRVHVYVPPCAPVLGSMREERAWCTLRLQDDMQACIMTVMMDLKCAIL
jgi:hypothetical protein